MKKTVFKVLAVFEIFCILFSVNAFALKEEIVKEGDIKYMNVTLESGDVVEVGEYSTYYEFNDDPTLKVGSVTINATGDEPVVIWDDAFMARFDQVESLTINGNGKVVIGTYAFYNTRIKELYLPENVVFEDDAGAVFEDCWYLKSVEIGCDLCPGVFENCSIENVTFTEDNDIKEIPKQAFLLGYFESFKLPKTIEIVREGAFDSCAWMTNIELNDGLKTIEKSAFTDCADLKSVVIPASVEEIGEQAFYDSGLTSITIPASVKEIGEMAFGYEDYYHNGVSIVRSKVEGFTIYGYRNTAAEAYAEENGFKFVEIGDVNGVSYNPSWSEVNDYSFNVDGRADKVQVIEANGATRTFARHLPNVSVTGYDAEGNEVGDMSRELDHEVWTIKTKLTADSDLQVHAKYGNEWVKSTYKFRVTTLRSDKTLKSAELSAAGGAQGRVGCRIVTGSGVKKVRVEYEDGMTSTYNTAAAILDAANMTYTYDFTVKTRHGGENLFKIYIKTPNVGWTYATTLTYTAE